jgi:hypothetical protein
MLGLRGVAERTPLDEVAGTSCTTLLRFEADLGSIHLDLTSVFNCGIVPKSSRRKPGQDQGYID